MTVELKSYAEIQAAKAEELAAFSGLKLIHIKRGVAELLAQIGSIGIFEHYTKHDISHIDAMLKLIDWIVPTESKARLTPADWLLTVLSIYFHDLAMLVTRGEFEARDRSGFPEFCQNVLFSGDAGVDYRAKVLALEPEARQRFLYQEYVRHTHAERIKNWVIGSSKSRLGISDQAIAEIDALLQPLDAVFRRDLGLVCESHHLDDLGDVRKYKLRQPYGQSAEERANLQYCAVLLRTVDLLHITRDRTPSLTFRLLNPTDPISQEEWAKQMAVRAVQSQFGKNRDGNFSEDAPRDTIEVHAHFNAPSGFFALTSYLNYVQAQLRMSNDWVEKSRREQGTGITFPWRFVDSSGIETQGFLSKTFEFNIDQEKILDLLTGHTLYNDAKVVLREIVQNAIDAVRLKCLEGGQDPARDGSITIHWDSSQRMLTVQDNGTGMSQEIIEGHLLKVGSSRYQTAEFKKQHPSFSPISRFGIGILSAFMIADRVEITTVHEAEEEARRLTLQSVHGRYLISKLDKSEDLIARELGPHGTRISLYLRPSAKLGSPLAIAQQWVVMPGCRVVYQKNSEAPVDVGYLSLKVALEEYIKSAGYDLVGDDAVPKHGDIKVLETTDPSAGVSLAVATRWSAYFKEWEFMNVPDDARILMSRRTAVIDERHMPLTPAIGTCVEGIRVSFESPGFSGRSLFAMANACGPGAPKTNVARSALEQTPELQAALLALYRLYARHIWREMEEHCSGRGFSTTWAVQEAKFIARRLFGGRGRDEAPLRTRLLAEALATEVPLLLVELENVRKNIRLSEFEKFAQFWTVHGYVFRSAEGFLRELETSASLRAIDGAVGGAGLSLPHGAVLCGDYADHPIRELIFVHREPIEVRVNHAQRRIDILWGNAEKAEGAKWIRFSAPRDMLRRMSQSSRVPQSKILSNEMWIPRRELAFSGVQDEEVLYADGRVFIRHDSALASFFIQVVEFFERDSLSLAQQAAFGELISLIGFFWTAETVDAESIGREIARFYEDRGKYIASLIPEDMVIEMMRRSSGRSFDPEAWSRQLQEREKS